MDGVRSRKSQLRTTSASQTPYMLPLWIQHLIVKRSMLSVERYGAAAASLFSCVRTAGSKTFQF